MWIDIRKCQKELDKSITSFMVLLATTRPALAPIKNNLMVISAIQKLHKRLKQPGGIELRVIGLQDQFELELLSDRSICFQEYCARYIGF